MINLCALTKYVLSRIIIDSTYSQKLFNVFFLKLEISVYDLRCCSSKVEMEEIIKMENLYLVTQAFSGFYN